MPSLLSQLVLFLSSYAPLFFVFALLDTFGKGIPSIIFTVVGVLAVIGLVGFFRVARGLNPVPVTIVTSRQRDTDAIAYVATYLLPFVGLGFGSVRVRIAIALFIGVVGVLYVRSELFYINPFLAMAGYRLFEVTTAGQRSLIVISKQRALWPESTIRVHPLGDYVTLQARHVSIE